MTPSFHQTSHMSNTPPGPPPQTPTTKKERKNPNQKNQKNPEKKEKTPSPTPGPDQDLDIENIPDPNLLIEKIDIVIIIGPLDLLPNSMKITTKTTIFTNKQTVISETLTVM